MSEGITNFHQALANTLDLLKLFDASQHGWEMVYSNSNTAIEIFRRSGPPGKTETNIKQILPIPMEKAISLLRAEGVVVEDSPFGELVEEAACLHSFSPGDWIASILLNKRFAALLDLLTCRKWPDTAGQPVVMRMVLHRDWPLPGHVFFAWITLEPCNFDPLWGIVLSEGSAPDTCVLNEVWRFPTPPSDVLVPVLEKIGRLYESLRWKQDVAPVEERHGFIVMNVRKCSRGPPLVPIAPQESQLEPLSEEWLDALTWEDYQDAQEFSLPPYLRMVLACFGKKEIPVYDSLDGRHLMFYQASAKRSDWLEIWGVLQLLMRRQASAYRRKLGGSAAPTFQGEVAPRFSDRQRPISETLPPCQEGLEQAEDDEDYPWTWPVPVKNTFVHFPTDRSDVDLQSSPV
eukprot:CAMPEP_0206423352 /NCGR_PEP_ID=MMETSP0324_2-20121206/2634_1 /ASSEMBLY_ACC=CAM_ASM_000836 /TAXON_ID=2866 /ORGANISM="Crypthecodinium cohnii, Strain Seligo" /LENGTH=402 /DNA_ID=CAMNT_0053887905 /DNA_START=28 /DNA_END=1236 /DNA_ORIENTATION=+